MVAPWNINIRNEDGSINIWKAYQKYIEPFTAIFILVGVFIMIGLIKEENNLKKQIIEEGMFIDDNGLTCYCKPDDMEKIKGQVEANNKKYQQDLYNSLANITLNNS